ncbi:hypothetical protein D9758_000500 [Tetrapyrgos nigripes]|uniref:Uncharacterized protein n=1 Tax=Tetrapyrgos nigripes TaxID=182062 RepID=A0A8H5LZC8_9AGAR|nr:hypothetical protein D9758_000500 [Tetrapyrgos nigripes]
MASDDAEKPNGVTTNASSNNTNASNSSMTSIEKDVSRLTALLSEPTFSDESLEELDERSLAELFKQLEGASGLMNGVEDKLDNILGNLDGLLAALEEKNTEKGNAGGDLKTDGDPKDNK